MAAADQWFLEGIIDQSRTVRRVPIAPLPFRIGRRRDQNLSIPSDEISKEHAEIFEDSSALWIRDLGSTNGTFVNEMPVRSEIELQSGDTIRLAGLRFRLEFEPSEEVLISGGSTAIMAGNPVIQQVVAGTRELRELLEKSAVVPHFQAIVDLSTGEPIGYEVLGRGNHGNLPTSPMELFEIAAILGVEWKLSEIFREAGLKEGKSIPGRPRLFVNTHPCEVERPGLIDSLRQLRAAAKNTPLTLEIHEKSITDLEKMRLLSEALFELDIEIAYDDFGAGQSRLLEIAEVPPKYVKFDRALITQIDSAPKQRQTMLASLTRMVHGLGIASIAEGVETEGEANVCAAIGFTYAQGFYFGRPIPASAIHHPATL